MQDPILMDVLESDADFKKKSPNFLLLERALVLKFEEMVEVAIVTVLHDDVEGIFLDERLLVAHDEGVY